MARGRGKQRPVLNTLEELKEYLAHNLDEPPFNESVWDKAVEVTKDKERAFKSKSVTEFDGKTKTKVTPNGPITPVGKYFQLMALPQYAKAAPSPEEEPTTGKLGADIDIRELDPELLNEFSQFKLSDRKWLARRMEVYYDNYDINDGADYTLAVQAVKLELAMRKQDTKLAEDKNTDAVVNALKNLHDQFLKVCDGLKALKKQRGAMEDKSEAQFSAFMDELEDSGDFKPVMETEADAIDKMLKELTISMGRVLTEG